MSAPRLGLAALCLFAAPLSACTWQVKVPSLESFARMGPDGLPTGYAVEVIEEALHRVGCRAEYSRFPVPRAWAALSAGEIDLLFGARHTTEREADAWFTPAIEHARTSLYVRRDAMPAAGLSTLADVRGTRLRIGIERLYSYGPEYDALLEDPAFLERLRIVVNRDGALAMFANGRLDAVFADAASIHLAGFDDAVRAVSLSTVPVHLAVSRARVSEDRFAAFAAALAAMSVDGTMDRLRAEAGIESEPPPGIGTPPQDTETPPAGGAP